MTALADAVNETLGSKVFAPPAPGSFVPASHPRGAGGTFGVSGAHPETSKRTPAPPKPKTAANLSVKPPVRGTPKAPALRRDMPASVLSATNPTHSHPHGPDKAEHKHTHKVSSHQHPHRHTGKGGHTHNHTHASGEHPHSHHQGGKEMSSLKDTVELSLKGREDQPRDDHGRWSASGADAADASERTRGADQGKPPAYFQQDAGGRYETVVTQRGGHTHGGEYSEHRGGNMVHMDHPTGPERRATAMGGQGNPGQEGETAARADNMRLRQNETGPEKHNANYDEITREIGTGPEARAVYETLQAIDKGKDPVDAFRAATRSADSGVVRLASDHLRDAYNVRARADDGLRKLSREEEFRYTGRPSGPQPPESPFGPRTRKSLKHAVAEALSA